MLLYNSSITYWSATGIHVTLALLAVSVRIRTQSLSVREFFYVNRHPRYDSDTLSPVYYVP